MHSFVTTSIKSLQFKRHFLHSTSYLSFIRKKIVIILKTKPQSHKMPFNRTDTISLPSLKLFVPNQSHPIKKTNVKYTHTQTPKLSITAQQHIQIVAWTSNLHDFTGGTGGGPLPAVCPTMQSQRVGLLGFVHAGRSARNTRERRAGRDQHLHDDSLDGHEIPPHRQNVSSYLRDETLWRATRICVFL